MATNFPSSLDVFTNPTSTSSMSGALSHAGQHSDANDAIEALQAKVGADGSAVTTSIDYRLNTLSYQYVQTVYFTSSGTFTKATYPWLRGIRVKCQAGGGGGGNSTTLNTGGGGGGGGAYVEKWITDIAGMAASETVTVGAGGGGGDYLSNATGGAGGASSFGSHALAYGGYGGFGGSAGTGGFYGTADAANYDLVISGQAGGSASSNQLNGEGGSSYLGAGGQSQNTSAGFSQISRMTGLPYGGGGAGSIYTSNTYGTSMGGLSGAAGIVIVELYA